MPAKICEWTSQEQAFAAFAGFTDKTQSAGHIKPLHWYVASRLVLEGGFDPDDIKPRPPFTVEPRKRNGLPLLVYDPQSAGGGEATVLGGLKTKNVDVVVARRNIGPVLAVSCKGTTGAFRNLTNRMEELIGDCTNLHISYPTLVMGYLHLLRANRRVGELFDVVEASDDTEDATEASERSTRRLLTKNDMAFDQAGEIVAEIRRFGVAVSRLAGRSGIRDDLTRYEAIAIALVEAEACCVGKLIPDYPDDAGPLGLARFFERLYLQYDERFVFGAPKLDAVTRRLTWSPESPALSAVIPDYPVRVGV